MLCEFGGKRPKLHRTAYVHPSAAVIGDVIVGKRSSIWPGAVVRGDFARIEVGDYSCIQDNSVVHPADTYVDGKPKYLPVKIGNYVVVGHNALVHGATISDNCVIGGGSIIFNGARVHRNSIVGMGAVVLGNSEVPSGTVVVGIPARPLRKLSEEEIRKIRVQAENYAKLAAQYKMAESKGSPR